MTKHGHTKGGKSSRVYGVWSSMVSRCTSPTNQAYARYGGRGITVCERWKTFENFLDDMGEPAPNLTIDRIDNNHGYSPENCRWSTRREQSNNRNCNRLITHNDTTLTIAEWARHLGVSHSLIFLRIKRGWSIERTLSETPKPHRVSELHTHDGETKSLPDWAKSSGIQYWTLRARIKAGWSFERSITTPATLGHNQFTQT